MGARFERIQASMAESAFDVLVLVPGPNYSYVSGGAPIHHSERLNLLFVPREGRPVAVTPLLEAPGLEGLPVERITWRDEEGPAFALQEAVQALRLNSRHIGVEYAQLRYGEAEQLQRAAPGATLVAADGLLTELRSIKDADEIAAMRRAIAITEEGLAATIAMIRPGMTEAQVAAELRINLLRAGSEGDPFGPLVVAGERSANPHFGPSDRELRPGDVVILDCGAMWGGYSGDITRCVALEPVPEEIVTIYELCLRANEAARAVAKAGVTGDEVDTAARQVISAQGYGERFIHRTGHGLGLEIHEPPYMVAENNAPLAVGMTFTIEPGIYLPGLGGVRVEDDVLITAEGCESLTTFSRELVRIG